MKITVHSHDDMLGHWAAVVQAGRLIGVIIDIDGITPSPQADGDPRPAGTT